MGINPIDLKEKTLEEFKFNSKYETNATEQVIEIRYIHFESRRRRKLKILAEYIRNNKHNLGVIGAKKDQNPTI